MSTSGAGGVHSINAITFRVTDMARTVRFWQTLGFELTFGAEDAGFSTLASGECFVNLIAHDTVETGWGRVIFHVGDVDELHARAVAGGLEPQADVRDAPWGERMFPIFDPDGHDISFAVPIRR